MPGWVAFHPPDFPVSDERRRVAASVGIEPATVNGVLVVFLDVFHLIGVVNLVLLGNDHVSSSCVEGYNRIQTEGVLRFDRPKDRPLR